MRSEAVIFAFFWGLRVGVREREGLWGRGVRKVKGQEMMGA